MKIVFVIKTQSFHYAKGESTNLYGGYVGYYSGEDFRVPIQRAKEFDSYVEAESVLQELQRPVGTDVIYFSIEKYWQIK